MWAPVDTILTYILTFETFELNQYNWYACEWDYQGDFMNKSGLNIA